MANGKNPIRPAEKRGAPNLRVEKKSSRKSKNPSKAKPPARSRNVPEKPFVRVGGSKGNHVDRPIVIPDDDEELWTPLSKTQPAAGQWEPHKFMYPSIPYPKIPWRQDNVDLYPEDELLYKARWLPKGEGRLGKGDRRKDAESVFEKHLWTQLFMDSPLGIAYGRGWSCTRLLGQGGFGRVGLWQKIDDAGNVLGNVAVKEEEDDDPQNVAIEYILTRRLNQAPTEHVVEYYNYVKFPRHGLHRFYMEASPYGDASKVPYRTMVPEAYIWRHFDALAQACVAMECGDPAAQLTETQKARGLMKPLWEPIVHRDMKNMNTLLTKSQEPAPFDYYPNVKISDFGAATILNARNTIHNSQTGFATPGYVPPELRPLKIDETLGTSISSATNIWQVGASINELIIGLHPNKPVDFEKQDMKKFERGNRRFTSDLKKLVVQCGQESQLTRPSATALAKITSERWAAIKKDMPNWMPRTIYGEWDAKTLRKMFISASVYKLGELAEETDEAWMVDIKPPVRADRKVTINDSITER